MTEEEAYKYLLKVPRAMNRLPKPRYFSGSTVTYQGQTYIHFYKLPDDRGLLDKYDKNTRKIEWKGVDYQNIIPAGQSEIQQVGTPDDNLVRYTRQIQAQLARSESAMERPFYRAGGRLDGSVIQHYPGSEILVVDFAQDEALKEFYERELMYYEKQSAEYKDALPLPKYLYERVKQVVYYDDKFDVGLLTGETQKRLGADLKHFAYYALKMPVERLMAVQKLPPLQNEKVYLGTYLKLGIGVCRQQATVVAACMERAISEGRAPGWLGVELRANKIKSLQGHAWAASLRSDRHIIVSDPARRYYGEEAGGTWNYGLGYETHAFGRPD